jgi:primosomal protein DnaI
MESLSDILKHIPTQVNADAKAKVKQVLQHTQVVKFLDKHPELDERSIRGSMPRLYQFATELDRCAACPGLANCQNDLAGYYTWLSVQESNGFSQICDHKVACKKLIAKQAEDAVKLRIRSFYVDEKTLAVNESLKDLRDFDKERAKAVLKVTQYITQTMDKGIQPMGLYLFGDFGTGKTYLMGHMLREMAKLGHTGVIVYMPEFMEDLKSMFQEPHKLKETIDMMKETDFLIFDDIGAENMNPWLRDHVMGSILNYRMNRKPTFYTSNYDLDRLAEHFSFTSKDGEDEEKGRRIMERIRPFVDLVAVEGSNKRGSS